MTLVADRIPVIDTDSHVSEPPDLWLSRLPRKWAELAPRIERNRAGTDVWKIGDVRVVPGWFSAAAGWHEYWPSFPRTQDEVDPASYDPVARAGRLDEFGVAAQVLYPNILGFYMPTLLGVGDRDFHLACFRAYNDFLTDFAAAAPGRFLPIMAMPFFDVEESVREIERCAAMGHKGILFSNAPEKAGYPALRDPHWDPILRAAQDTGLSINFHFGFGVGEPTETSKTKGTAQSDEERQRLASFQQADFVKSTVMGFLSNAQAIVELIVSGLCDRYPGVNFVSVESGFGYVPYVIEALDWQWLNGGAAAAYPDRLMPSEYFRRQIYTTFWFEQQSLNRLVDLYPDNVMFETDFPHTTCLAPGPVSHTDSAKHVIEANLKDLPEDTIRKVLYETAARVYRVELDEPTRQVA